MRTSEGSQRDQNRWPWQEDIISVTVIRVGPPGYFTHVSTTTPIVSALKNYYVWGFLEVPTDFIKCFWIQVTVSLLKPPHGGFRSETAVTKPFRK